MSTQVQRTRIILENDFHRTEAIVLCEAISSDSYELSASQYRRARRKLCGMKDCTCGMIRGGGMRSVEIRAPSRWTSDAHTIVIHGTMEDDGRVLGGGRY